MPPITGLGYRPGYEGTGFDRGRMSVGYQAVDSLYQLLCLFGRETQPMLREIEHEAHWRGTNASNYPVELDNARGVLGFATHHVNAALGFQIQKNEQ